MLGCCGGDGGVALSRAARGRAVDEKEHDDADHDAGDDDEQEGAAPCLPLFRRWGGGGCHGRLDAGSASV